jgi:hypothetical protein
VIDAATRSATTRRAATDATTDTTARAAGARASFGAPRALVGDRAGARFVLVVTARRRAARRQHHGWNNAGPDDAANGKACFSHRRTAAIPVPHSNSINQS